MGNVASRQLDIHRFLGLAVCHSTTVDPRHLEHLNYTYWTGDIAALVISGELKYSLIAPQFPIYVSPKEPSPDPNSSFGSGITEADGEARGVYVDIAIAMPIVQPRELKELGSIAATLVGRSLDDFFENIEPKDLRELSPRCLWVSGLHAPLLGELKPGPTRHPKTIHAFYSNLSGLLSEGTLQAEQQALCLFCSWRFATQDNVLLLAGAGDYYRIRWVTRQWAVETLGGRRYQPDLLKKLKAAGTERFDASSDSDHAVRDGDWTGDKEDEMYGDPLDARDRQEKLNRDQRAQRRDEHRQRFADALNTSPSEDRTAPLFTDAALNLAHNPKSHEDPGSNFFQSEPADKYLSHPGRWSDVLRLGSVLSNQYMDQVQHLIRQQEIEEKQRRKTVFFQYERSV